MNAEVKTMSENKSSEPAKEEKQTEPKKPSMKRRCSEHDYLERGIYMVTMAIEGRQPLLGRLAGNAEVAEGPEAPHVVLSSLGQRVQQCWMDIARYYPQIEVMKLCVMPDHIHGVLFVHERLGRHLGHVINGFKTGCRKAARELGIITAAMPQHTQPLTQNNTMPYPALSTNSSPTSHPYTACPSLAQSLTTASPHPAQGQTTASASTTQSPVAPRCSQEVGCVAAMPQRRASHPAHGQLWEPNYNDRILRKEGQLKRMLAYLDDNPRRLLLKRQHPEFFTRLADIPINGTAFQAMGNRFLLDNPVKLQVQCSRHLYQKEIDERLAYFLAEGKKGAILVSPCISDGEQQIATAAMHAGIPLIVLLLRGFSAFYKPHGRYLEACSTGRLLMLTPYPFQTEKIENMRQRCLQLNAWAAEICKK